MLKTPLLLILSEGAWNWTVNLRFEPRNDTKFFKTQIWFDINPWGNKDKNYTSQLKIDNSILLAIYHS